MTSPILKMHGQRIMVSFEITVGLVNFTLFMYCITTKVPHQAVVHDHWSLVGVGEQVSDIVRLIGYYQMTIQI